MTSILCPQCKRTCRIVVSEREGEGENGTGTLVPTHCYEAWAQCPTHGWVSPNGDTRTWSEEKMQDEPLTASDREQAREGLRDVMRTAELSHSQKAEMCGRKEGEA